MASADQIKALLRSFVDRDDAQFLSIAMQVAAYEAKRGHGKLAEEIKEMIDSAKNQRAGHELLGHDPTPISKPRGELANLVAVNLVIGWTSLHTQSALAALKLHGVILAPEVLRHVSPIRYSNINFRGTFRFPVEQYLVALLGDYGPRKGKALHG